MKIKLYHGTSSKIYEKIKNDGFLKPGFLTSDLTQAEYYSECAAQEDNSEQIILLVSADLNHLEADTNSYDEPLSYILKNNNTNEDDWNEAIEKGEIVYPKKNQWHISLERVESVRNKLKIFIKDICEDELNFTEKQDILNAIQKKYSAEQNKKFKI